MKKLKHSVQIDSGENYLEHSPGNYNHIPNLYGITTFHTLCGWCDVDNEEVDIVKNKINCPVCIKIYHYIKNMSIDKRNFEI